MSPGRRSLASRNTSRTPCRAFVCLSTAALLAEVVAQGHRDVRGTALLGRRRGARCRARRTRGGGTCPRRRPARRARHERNPRQHQHSQGPSVRCCPQGARRRAQPVHLADQQPWPGGPLRPLTWVDGPIPGPLSSGVLSAPPFPVSRPGAVSSQLAQSEQRRTRETPCRVTVMYPATPPATWRAPPCWG